MRVQGTGDGGGSASAPAPDVSADAPSALAPAAAPKLDMKALALERNARRAASSGGGPR